MSVIPPEDRRDVILLLMGFYMMKTKGWDDLKVHVDQHLTDSLQPATTYDEWDDLTSSYEAVWVILKQNQLNRQDLRDKRYR